MLKIESSYVILASQSRVHLLVSRHLLPRFRIAIDLRRPSICRCVGCTGGGCSSSSTCRGKCQETMAG